MKLSAFSYQLSAGGDYGRADEARDWFRLIADG